MLETLLFLYNDTYLESIKYIFMCWVDKQNAPWTQKDVIFAVKNETFFKRVAKCILHYSYMVPWGCGGSPHQSSYMKTKTQKRIFLNGQFRRHKTILTFGVIKK